MCYFKDQRATIRHVKKKDAILAWKGLDRAADGLRSPHRLDAWQQGVPQRASAQGFYAMKERPEVDSPEAGSAFHVFRVRIWGKVREYKAQPERVLSKWWEKPARAAGYRAEWCEVVREWKPRKREGK